MDGSIASDGWKLCFYWVETRPTKQPPPSDEEAA